MLQVMDDARLTDGKANTIDFKNCIIIMTSNLEDIESQKADIGFIKAASSQPGDPRNDKAVRGFFLPEFINRLSGMIRFNPLERHVMNQMVDKLINLLQKKTVKRDVTIDLSPAARDYLADKGYDREFGARPLGRLIEREVKVPLSRAILFGELAKGGNARVDFDTAAKTLTFTFNGKADGQQPNPQADRNNIKTTGTEQKPKPGPL
jgi:ATP-dependent Clp protease ATP-binding subunit ClpA